MRLRSSTRVFSPIVSIVAVPPGTLAAHVSFVVWSDSPRIEHVSRIVMPAVSVYDPGITQTVTPPAGRAMPAT